MLHTVIYFSFILIVSALFALVEIQVEGPNGWAADLPTWRIKNRWTDLFWSCRELTGYHLYLQAFIVSLLHFPFAIGLAAFSWKGELRIVSFFMLFWVVEDFLWFVLNPAFGIRRFRAEYIPWHKPTWMWIAPRDYWVFTPIALALYRLSL